MTLMEAFDRELRADANHWGKDTDSLLDLFPTADYATPREWFESVCSCMGITAIPGGGCQYGKAKRRALLRVSQTKVSGLSPREMEALIVFWKRYMKARKTFDAYQSEQAKLQRFVTDCQQWTAYLSAKMNAMNELRKVIPEAGSAEIWRNVTLLKPQEVVTEILKERAKNNQRNAEKNILTGKQ